MKKILFILSLAFSAPCLHAQAPICPALQNFTGEWRYVNGPDTIRIYLRYHECNFNLTNEPNDINANLWGWHEYKRGDSIIESNYSNRFMPLPAHFFNASSDAHSILLSLPGCNTLRPLFLGTIFDLSQGRELKMVNAQFDTTMTQIEWSQRQGEGYGFTGYYGMTLPRNFVLIKQ